MAKKNDALTAPNRNTSLTAADAASVDLDSLITPMSADALNEAASTGKVRPRVLTLPEGGMIRSVRVIGKGPNIEVNPQNPNPLEPDKKDWVSSWHLEVKPGLEVHLVSSYQLDHELPELIDHVVSIGKGIKKSVGKRMVNQFTIIDHGVINSTTGEVTEP